MAKTKTAPEKKPAGVTGTYKYDRETGQVVLVSADVPKVASKGSAAPKTCESSGGPCCGGGACGA